MGHGIQAFAAKAELLERAVRGRNVLHLGAVGEVGRDTAEKVERFGDSVHAELSGWAGRCVGVDIDAEAVAALLATGRFDDLVALDATQIRRPDVPLPRIDVIVAGDIIEHLAEPGVLLRRLHELAEAGTELIVTTPNALGLPQLLRYLRGRAIEGDDHVCSFNVYSLTNLLRACGWRVTSVDTCYQRRATAQHGRVGFRVGDAVLRAWPAVGGTLFARCRPD